MKKVIEISKKGVYALFIDEFLSKCPYQNSHMYPDNSSKMQMKIKLQEFPCNSTCPLFEYREKNETLHLHCGNGHEMLIEEVRDKRKPDLKIKK